MSTIKPNFFILGAPKCGTSALASYLASHPDVFFSPIKEPHYFATDFEYRHTTYESQYLSLFSRAPQTAQALGEASTHYLESRDAVPNILEFNPSSKFIVMLRSPMEMAPALHAQMVIGGIENEFDFASAWRLNHRRREGQDIPALCVDSKFVCYLDACLLGAFMERLLSHVKRERLLVIFFDDFKQNPAASYEQVLRFLGLANDVRSSFPVINSRKRVRRVWLQKALLFLGLVKRKIGIKRGLGVYNQLAPFVFSEQPSKALSDELVNEMKSAFRDDIRLLERLMGRDLSHWLS